MQAAAENREDYEALASELDEMANTLSSLNQLVGELDSEASDSITRILR
jgi:hypothetical protein